MIEIGHGSCVEVRRVKGSEEELCRSEESDGEGAGASGVEVRRVGRRMNSEP